MFIPKRIIFEKNALNYEMGKNIYEKFKDKAEIITLTNNKIKGNIPGDNIMEYYKEGKNINQPKFKCLIRCLYLLYILSFFL